VPPAGGWDAVTYDARGHGDSDWSSAGDYLLDDLVGDLHAVVAATCGSTPVLVGASMGGMTSLIAQGEQPDTARALVLVDIVPRVEAAGVQRIQAFMHGAPDGFASLEDVAEAVRAYNPARRRPVDLDGLRKNVRQREDGRWYWHWDPAMMSGRREPDLDERRQRILAATQAVVVPVLLLHGAQSDIVSAEGIAELLAMVPSARAVQISGAGHMVAGDDNSVFARDVLPFLEELPAPTPG
jgi:pimeloyl-ACP methyl ester carboxylesterase